MALVLKTNSYADLVTADAYLSDRFDAADWSSLSDSDKEHLLILATSVIDYRFAPFLSSASSSTQPLAFPRESFSYWDDIRGLWVEVADDDTIPYLIQQATIILASHFASNRTALFDGESNVEWNSLGLDGLSISRDVQDGPTGTKKLNLLPYEVMVLVDPLVHRNGKNRNNWWRSN